MAEVKKDVIDERLNNSVRYLNHKGYIGSVEYSETDKVFHGKVLGIRSLISFEGFDAESIKQDFQNSIDEYLEFCADNNIEPEDSCRDQVWDIFLQGLSGFSDDFMKDGRELQEDQERESFD